jgi:hypothetical protein
MNKQPAPTSSLIVQMTELKSIVDLFRRSNLDLRLQHAIEQEQLFVMPEHCEFQRPRAQSPVSLVSVSIGPNDEATHTPLIIVRYHAGLMLTNIDGDSEEHRVTVDLYVPERFFRYHIESPVSAFGRQMVFDLNLTDFKRWSRVEQEKWYDRELESAAEVVKLAKARVKHLRGRKERWPEEFKR